MAQYRFLLVLSVAILAGNSEVVAQVDQDHWVPDPSNNAFNSLLGLQQEFTPTFNSMDSAEFSLGQGLMDITSVAGGPVVLNLRQGGVGGPIIAASDTVNVPPMFHGAMVFSFAQPVALVPGQVYAMEPFSPTQATLVFDANRPGFTPGYEDGRLFYNGQFEGVDLVFREGLGLVPEPAPPLLMAVGGIGAALAWGRKRRPFRDGARPHWRTRSVRRAIAGAGWKAPELWRPSSEACGGWTLQAVADCGRASELAKRHGVR